MSRFCVWIKFKKIDINDLKVLLIELMANQTLLLTLNA